VNSLLSTEPHRDVARFLTQKIDAIETAAQAFSENEVLPFQEKLDKRQHEREERDAEWTQFLTDLDRANKLLNQLVPHHEPSEIRPTQIDTDSRTAPNYGHIITGLMAGLLTGRLEGVNKKIADWRRNHDRNRRLLKALRGFAIGVTVIVAAADFIPVRDLRREVAAGLLLFVLSEIVLEPILTKYVRQKERRLLKRAAGDAASIELQFTETKDRVRSLMRVFRPMTEKIGEQEEAPEPTA
jgi:hypothetical protein